MAHLDEISSDAFDDAVTKSPTPVLVKFTGAGCATCVKMDPVLESLAQETDPATLRVVQVDVHAAVDVAARYGVMSLPTLLLFKKGRPAGQWVGFVAKETLKKKLEPLLA